jgi:hypothetical protein
MLTKKTLLTMTPPRPVGPITTVCNSAGREPIGLLLGDDLVGFSLLGVNAT